MMQRNPWPVRRKYIRQTQTRSRQHRCSAAEIHRGQEGQPLILPKTVTARAHGIEAEPPQQNCGVDRSTIGRTRAANAVDRFHEKLPPIRTDQPPASLAILSNAMEASTAAHRLRT